MSKAGAGSGERVWGGTTLAERRAQRKAKLLETALDLIGEQGGAGVTVRSVCRRAGLTDRYFYESFASRDELLAALFMQVADELHQEMLVATTGDDRERQARDAVDALMAVALDDPRRGRLLLVEPFSEPALAGAGIASVPAFTKLIQSQLPRDVSRSQRLMTAVGLAGSFTMLLASWLVGTLPVSRDELVEHCVEMILGAYGGPG